MLRNDDVGDADSGRARSAERAPSPAACRVPAGQGSGKEASKATARVRLGMGGKAYHAAALRVTNKGVVEVKAMCGSRIAMVAEEFVNSVAMAPARAQSMVDWIAARVGEWVDDTRIQRMGFLDGDWQPREGVAADGYQVLRILYSGEVCEGLEPHRYFASDKPTGGLRTFWAMQFQTLEAHSAMAPGLDDLCSECTDVDEERTKVTRSGEACWEFRRSPARIAAYMDGLDAYCVANAGKFVRISLPGNRAASTTSSKYHLARLPVHYTAWDGQCVRASLLNALHAIGGTAEEVTDVASKGRIVVDSLAGLQRWVERNLGTFRLQREDAPWVCDIDHWLHGTAGRSVVYLMRLEATDEDGERIDHCVTIDAQRSAVLDPCEKFGLSMHSGVLGTCVGDGYQLERVLEMRRLVRQPVTSKPGKKKKPRRNPKDRKKRRMEKKRRREEMGDEIAKKKARVKKVVESDSDSGSD